MARILSERDVADLKEGRSRMQGLMCGLGGPPVRPPPLANHYAANAEDFRIRLGTAR